MYTLERRERRRQTRWVGGRASLFPARHSRPLLKTAGGVHRRGHTYCILEALAERETSSSRHAAFKKIIIGLPVVDAKDTRLHSVEYRGIYYCQQQ
jgi:hypothetical protein